MTWKDYCEKISSDNCKTADFVAARPPSNEDEEDNMFSKGNYTGHFIKTEKNDCSNNSTECSGHFADYPCGWTTYVRQQAYHLNIGIEPTGYTYNQLVEIWAAANATKSDVMGFWWQPEGSFQSYQGTDAEHTRITLTRPSQTCYDNRVNPLERCGDDFDKLVGSPLGSCDTAPQALTKILAGNLQALSEDPELPESLWSPAYQAVTNYKITALQLQDIFQGWLDKNTDKWHYDPREATCEWVVENFELVKSFVPETYPRVLSTRDASNETLFIIACCFAVLVMAIVVISGAFTFRKRGSSIMHHTQIEFMYLLLAGVFIVAAAALLNSIPPTDMTCVVLPWLYNIGYCFTLLPTLVKIDAINRLFSSGKQMQHVRLSQKVLFGSVLLACTLATTFCLIWTLIDPKEETRVHKLSEDPNLYGEFDVEASNHCASSSDIWIGISYGWPAVITLLSLVLAFMASRVREDVNDTKVLSALIMSQFLFAILRLVLLVVNGSLDKTDFMAYESLVLSADGASTLLIFVIPKLFMESDVHKASEAHLPDIFLRTSIMYADIHGFVGWSSVREPAQVFKFLEAVYGDMDDICDKLKVFKVETVAQTYGTLLLMTRRMNQCSSYPPISSIFCSRSQLRQLVFQVTPRITR